MLTAQELKIVIDTLNTRKAWLLKSTSDSSLNEKNSQQHKESVTLLESAIQKINSMGSSSTTEQEEKKEVVDLNFSKLRVLIAEDDADSATLLKDILGDLGTTTIDIATDGIQALKQIFKATKPYHLVLCDWDMPGKKGTEVHDALRADNRFSRLSFIMVSAVADAKEIQTAIQQGIDDYMVKPIDSEILKRKITKAINQRASQ